MQSFGKKILSAALSLVLLAGAYPASVYADSTAANAATAASARLTAPYTDKAIAVNGSMTSEDWSVHAPIGKSGTFGAMWDTKNLYLLISNPNKEDITLTLNGVEITKDNASLKTGSSKRITEYAIPFDSIGVSVKDYNTEIDTVIRMESGTWDGVIELSSTDYFVAVNSGSNPSVFIRHKLGMALVDPDGNPTDKQNTQNITNGYKIYDRYNPNGVNPPSTRTFFGYQGGDFTKIADRSAATVAEFTFKANSMPVYKLGADNDFFPGFATCGFSFWMNGTQTKTGEFPTVSAGIINTEGGLVFIARHAKGDSSYPLGKEVGDTFRIGTRWETNGDLTLYVDGVKVAVFENVECLRSQNYHDYYDSAIIFNVLRSKEPAASEADNIDVDITNIALGKSFGDSVADSLTYASIADPHMNQFKVWKDLKLPSSVSTAQLSAKTPVTWKSSDTSVITDAGKVTQPETNGKYVTLTATFTDLGITKVIPVYVQGKNPTAQTLVVFDDENTAKGAGEVLDTYEFSLDSNHNSLVYSLGEVKTVNTVTLKDSDTTTRLNETMLTIWASDDNKTYTQIDSFKFLRDGEYTYLYDFEATCAYLKVHCTTHDTDYSDFTAPLTDIITVSYSDVFGDGGKRFATESKATVNNDTDADKYDVIASFTPDEFGVNTLADNRADVRVFLGGELLYHYFDGEKFFVRIPKIEKNSTVELTVLSGNADATDISCKESVYEITYGTRETYDGYVTHGRYYLELPGGRLLSLNNKGSGGTPFTYSMSNDQGRTWTVPMDAIGSNNYLSVPQGECYDDETGRILVQGFIHPDETLVTNFMYSDNMGRMWKKAPLTNLGKECNWFLVYTDIVKISSYDGEDGPGVDFVLPLSCQDHESEEDLNVTRVAYTTDCGLTWTLGADEIVYPHGISHSNRETGCCEPTLLEADDGTLVVLSRCQYNNVDNFARAFSYDHGLTWTTEAELSDVYATNTQPILFEYNDGKFLMWGGNTVLGGVSYRRYPLNLAVSYDNMDTFENILDVYSRTALWGMTTGTRTDITNPLVEVIGGSMIASTSGDGMFVIRIDDFEDYFYRTRGAYDSFENSSVAYEGWSPTGGMVTVSTNKSTDGEKSMLFTPSACAVRSVPYIQNGEISFDLWIEDVKNVHIELELESAYSDVYGEAAPIGMTVDKNGITFLGVDKAVDAGLKNGWNHFSFALSLLSDTPSAVLTVNDGKAIDVPVNAEIGDYVTFVDICTFGENATYLDAFLVIDDDPAFYPTDLANAVESELTEVPASLSDKYTDVAAMNADMQSLLFAEAGDGYTAENSKIADITIEYSRDNGKTWKTAKPDDLYTDGMTVRFAYPEGTTAVSHEFKLLQMYTANSYFRTTEIGGHEMPEITEGEDGLYVTLKGISPVLLAWTQVAEIPDTTDPGTSGTPGTPDTPGTPGEGGSSAPLWIGVGAGVIVIAAVAIVIGKKFSKKSA